jgi:hypothetical protein
VSKSLSASNFRGRECGDRLPARARVVPDQGIDGLLRRKYAWQKRALDLLNGRADAGAWATIEISDSAA